MAETCPLSFVGEFDGVYWHYAEYYNPTCNDATPTWWPDVMELACPFWCGFGVCIPDSSLKATTPVETKAGTPLPADGALATPARPGLTAPVEVMPRLVVGSRVIRRWQSTRRFINPHTGRVESKTFVIGIHMQNEAPSGGELPATEVPLPGPARQRPVQMKLVQVNSTHQFIPVLLHP